MDSFEKLCGWLSMQYRLCRYILNHCVQKILNGFAAINIGTVLKQQFSENEDGDGPFFFNFSKFDELSGNLLFKGTLNLPNF